MLVPAVLALGRWSQKNRDLKIILGHIESSELAWATCNPVSERREGEREKRMAEGRGEGEGRDRGEGREGRRKRELTTEFLLEKVLEALPALGVSNQFAEVESPSLHPHLGWDLHPARMLTGKCGTPSETGWE